MGTIRTARATLPARAEKCPIGRTSHVQAKMPTTIDGVPFRTSATNRTVQPRRPEPYSARYSPVPMPTGRPISAASPTMITVPTIAFATPPPDWPGGTGFLTKKLQSRDDAPLATRYPRMRTRASTATNDSAATRAVIAPLTMGGAGGARSQRPAPDRRAASDAPDHE